MQTVSERLFAEAHAKRNQAALAKAEGRTDGPCQQGIDILDSAARFARRVIDKKGDRTLHNAWQAVEWYVEAYPRDGWAQLGADNVLANIDALEEICAGAHVCNLCVRIEINDVFEPMVVLAWGACEREDEPETP